MLTKLGRDFPFVNINGSRGNLNAESRVHKPVVEGQSREQSQSEQSWLTSPRQEGQVLDREAAGRVSGLGPGCSHPQEGKRLWVSCSLPGRQSEGGGNIDDVALSL